MVNRGISLNSTDFPAAGAPVVSSGFVFTPYYSMGNASGRSFAYCYEADALFDPIYDLSNVNSVVWYNKI